MNVKLILGIIGGFFGSVILLLLIGFLLMGRLSKRGGCPLKTQSNTATTTSNSDTDFL